MNKNTVLVVDDDKSVLKAMRRLFRKEGFQVLTAASGREALEILSQFPVQLVISDQRMPELEGVKFLQEVKILEPMSLPWEIIPTIQQHHERYDGKGYPEGRRDYPDHPYRPCRS